MKDLKRSYEKAFYGPAPSDYKKTKPTATTAPVFSANDSENIEIGSIPPEGILSSNSVQSTLLPQPSIGVLSSTAKYANANTSQSTMGQPKASFYENASNFAVYNPIMGENFQVTQVQTFSGSALKDMLEYTMPGAQYDSSIRDTPPRCHPGTRTRILEDVQTRIHSPDLTTRMIWIYGPAGVGKSAIMQTLAEAEASRDTTFTTLFFSRPNGRDDPKKVFTTLAYNLAVHSLEYRHYIEEKLANDPTFLAKSMDKQFQQLFVTPFLTPFTKNHISFNSQRWVVLLDGLDECCGEGEQRRIAELIRKSILHCAMSSPFIWVIASRPEVHLKAHFAKAKTDVRGYWELEVPIDSEESLRDVERYLHAQFSNMRENDPDSIPPLWPSESDFLKVSAASSGLFIFASTLIAYLLGGDPIFRLRLVVSLVKTARAQTVNPRQNPFQMLDLLYIQIMSDIPKEVLPTTKLLLGLYLLVSQGWSGIPLLRASNVLQLEQYEVYGALRKLHSVLDCPPPHEAETHPIRFLHAPFSDFLLDPSRSQTYFINLREEITKIWQRCTKILHQFEFHHAYNHVNLSWSPSVVPLGLQKSVWRDAQKFWIGALLASQKGAGKNWVLIDNGSIVETLRMLGPSIFLEAPGGTMDFLGWLDKSAPPEVRSDFLLKIFPLHDLNTNKLFKSLCARNWCFCISRETPTSKSKFRSLELGKFGTSEWLRAKKTLWKEWSVLGDLLLRRNRQAASWVLGFEGARQCVVIGPVISELKAGLAYYILPYFDTRSG